MNAAFSQEALLAKVHEIVILKGEGSQQKVFKTLNSQKVPSFEKCALYLPKDRNEATLTIKLKRTEPGKFSLTCF